MPVDHCMVSNIHLLIVAFEHSLCTCYPTGHLVVNSSACCDALATSRREFLHEIDHGCRIILNTHHWEEVRDLAGRRRG